MVMADTKNLRSCKAADLGFCDPELLKEQRADDWELWLIIDIERKPAPGNFIITADTVGLTARRFGACIPGERILGTVIQSISAKSY
jgi:hypothetical protein